MKVLIVGDYKFVGAHLAKRFYKEGYEIYIIGSSVEEKNKDLKFKHRLYSIDESYEKCEEVFSSHRFEFVIYLLSASKNSFKSIDGVKSLRMYLDLSLRYKIKKFIYVSSTELNRIQENYKREEDYSLKFDIIDNLCEEDYCRLFDNLTTLEVLSLRVSKIYGPRKEDGFIYNAIRNLLIAKSGGLSLKGEGDYIYVSDAVDAIYKATVFSNGFIINVSSSKLYKNEEIYSYIEMLHEGFEKDTFYFESEEQTFENDIAKSELKWREKYALKTGLQRTYNWYKENKDKFIKDESTKKRKSIIKKAIPYIENLAVFFITWYIHIKFKEINIDTRIDLRLIYILIMSMTYGTIQSIIAVILSIVWSVGEVALRGQSLVSLLYDPDILLSISIYILVGGVISYRVDSKKYELEKLERENEKIKDRFDFIYEMYNELKENNKELERRVSTSKDSFGKIYRIVERLDSFSSEKLFIEAINIIEEIMGYKSIFIYTLSNKGKYLRLEAKSNELNREVPKSIEVSKYSEIINSAKKNEIFINKKMEKNSPSMVAPLFYKEKIFGFIGVYNMKFEDMSLYNQNLLRVIANLIQSYMIRAHEFNEAIREERYILGTQILKEEYFKEVLRYKKIAEEKKYAKYTLVRVESKIDEKMYIDIINMVRDRDYLGYLEDEHVYILFSNTDDASAEKIIERFKENNIKVVKV